MRGPARMGRRGASQNETKLSSRRLKRLQILSRAFIPFRARACGPPAFGHLFPRVHRRPPGRPSVLLHRTPLIVLGIAVFFYLRPQSAAIVARAAPAPPSSLAKQLQALAPVASSGAAPFSMQGPPMAGGGYYAAAGPLQGPSPGYPVDMASMAGNNAPSAPGFPSAPPMMTMPPPRPPPSQGYAYGGAPMQQSGGPPVAYPMQQGPGPQQQQLQYPSVQPQQGPPPSQGYAVPMQGSPYPMQQGAGQGAGQQLYPSGQPQQTQLLYNQAPPPPQPRTIDWAPFASRYQINPKLVPYLDQLPTYTTVLLCDDSGSMREMADPDLGRERMTRWDELKQAVSIVIDAHAMAGVPCDIYFINRPGTWRNITSYNQVTAAFLQPPNGRTNTVATLQRIAQDHLDSDVMMSRRVCIHIFTDGHPTNLAGSEDIDGFARWLRYRPNINKSFISIVLCTDDPDIDEVYRRFEYNPGRNAGIQGVDVTEDFRGETRDIIRTRGKKYPFSFGDYIVKILVGAIDPTIHLIDLPGGPCCAIS